MVEDWQGNAPPTTQGVLLPLLPVQAGLSEGHQAFEAGRSRMANPLKMGGRLATEGMGERGKASSPALAKGEGVQQLPLKGAEARRKGDGGWWWLGEPCCLSSGLLGTGLGCCPCLLGPLL